MLALILSVWFLYVLFTSPDPLSDPMLWVLGLVLLFIDSQDDGKSEWEREDY